MEEEVGGDHQKQGRREKWAHRLPAQRNDSLTINVIQEEGRKK